MAEAGDDIPKINSSEVEALIEKIRRNKLEEQDKKKREEHSYLRCGSLGILLCP